MPEREQCGHVAAELGKDTMIVLDAHEITSGLYTMIALLSSGNVPAPKVIAYEMARAEIGETCAMPIAVAWTLRDALETAAEGIARKIDLARENQARAVEEAKEMRPVMSVGGRR